MIPCYNSLAALSLNLSYLLDNLDKDHIKYEIIVVDDGSDSAYSCKCLLEEFDFTHVDLPVNIGKGGALRAGFDIAKGSYIVYTDSDIPYSYLDLKLMYLTLKNGEFSFVIGDRDHCDSVYYDYIGMKRRVFSYLYSKLTSFLLSQQMDTQCGLKGFEATVGKELFKLSKINAFAIDNEILLLAKEKELKCATIPVSLRSIDGKSVSVVRDGLYMFKDLIILKAKSLFKR